MKDVEIVLVDSGSTDATLEVASRDPVKVKHIAPQSWDCSVVRRGRAVAG